jgi:hypothetical protein
VAFISVESIFYRILAIKEENLLQKLYVETDWIKLKIKKYLFTSPPE